MERLRINKKKYKISEKRKGSLIYQIISKKGKDLLCFCCSDNLNKKNIYFIYKKRNLVSLRFYSRNVVYTKFSIWDRLWVFVSQCSGQLYDFVVSFCVLVYYELFWLAYLLFKFINIKINQFFCEILEQEKSKLPKFLNKFKELIEKFILYFHTGKILNIPTTLQLINSWLLFKNSKARILKVPSSYAKKYYKERENNFEGFEHLNNKSIISVRKYNEVNFVKHPSILLNEKYNKDGTWDTCTMKLSTLPKIVYVQSIPQIRSNEIITTSIKFTDYNITKDIQSIGNILDYSSCISEQTRIEMLKGGKNMYEKNTGASQLEDALNKGKGDCIIISPYCIYVNGVFVEGKDAVDSFFNISEWGSSSLD